MKKFKLQLSGFDIAMLVAFVVIGLLGGGAWWYLSGQLQQAQADAKAASDALQANSTKGADVKYVVSNPNLKALQDDDALLKAQIDPLIKTYLLGKNNTLPSVDREDPVAWKHRLDNDVSELNTLAKTHAVTVPPSYYFGFSRYLNSNPNDEQTTVLRKQLLAIKTLTTIMINAGVNSIDAIQRTYEEDPHAPGESSMPGTSGESDHLNGFAATAQGNMYTAYPFEFTFQTESENLRTVVDDVIKAPYVFVIRTLTVKNSAGDSPRKDDLDKMSAPDGSAVPANPSDPNATNTPAATRGPQYLFGSSTLQVKARIDLIEWTIKSADDATNAAAATPPKPGAHHP
jgi:hypothetical protein